MSITLAIQYTLSKAVLKQAEIEVTAKPSTAFPLARIMTRLIEQNPGLSSIFMAKLVAMTGPWVVAMPIPHEPVRNFLFIFAILSYFLHMKRFNVGSNGQ